MKNLCASLLLALCTVPAGGAPQRDDPSSIRLLAFGDVNLGRWIGQQILNGDSTYPFRGIAPLLSRSDIVFANLEGPISDQHGLTESKKSNVVFCAPPQAAAVLRMGKVSIVSTANNHAFDFGLKGISETLQYLDGQHICSVGTTSEEVKEFTGRVVECRGIRVGFAAYTQFVNIHGAWEGRIANYDRERAAREIEKLRSASDFVIASFHGGKEFADTPDPQAVTAMRALIDAGADVVIGHHPHVPQGIEQYRGKLIFYSLGNFVFIQSPFWTRIAYGVSMKLDKKNGKTEVASVDLIPIRACGQPVVLDSPNDVAKLIDRLRHGSTASLVQYDGRIIVQR